MSLVTTLVVVVYLMAVGYLGYRGFRQTKSAADYMVAGRSVHPFIMALSYGATFISTSAIVGFGGVAGMFGMSLLWLTFLNIFVGIFLAFVCLGGPTRKMGHHLDAHTFPELLGLRYASKGIQVFSGLVIFLFIPLYAAAVLIGGCEFISTSFGITYDVALLVFSVIIAAYVIMGGLKGVMYTDALQGSIMFVGMLILLVACYAKLGGVVEAHQQLTEMAKEPNIFGGVGFKGWTSMPAFGWGAADTPKGPNPAAYSLWWIVVSTITLGVGIGVLAQPQLAVRFMTVRSKKELNRAVLVGGIFILVMTGVAFTVGSLSNLYFRRYEEVTGTLVGVKADALVVAKKERDIEKAVPCILLQMDTTGDEEADTHLVYRGAVPPVVPIMPQAVIIGHEDLTPEGLEALVGAAITVKPQATAFTRSVVRSRQDDGSSVYSFNTDSIIPTYITSAMPPWFGLVFLMTLLAAAMSTLSSQFHAVGTSIGRDVYETIKGKHAQSVGVARLGIMLGIVIAVIISHYARGGYIVARATAIFFGLCASTFLPAFVGGLFSRKMNKKAAWTSMIVGFMASAVWLVFIKDKEARALGICHALFKKHSLLLDKGSWAVVDPVVIALPLSILAAVIVMIATKPMDKEHLDWCYGGAEPGGAKSPAENAEDAQAE